MTRKSDDTQSSKGADPEKAADDGRMKQQRDVETRRPAEAPATAKSHPKLHRSEDEGPIQDSSGEPVVEDEP